MLIKRLIDNTPELTDAERERLFGPQDRDGQEHLADLFWACQSPEQRGIIYSALRGWFVDMIRHEGARV